MSLPFPNRNPYLKNPSRKKSPLRIRVAYLGLVAIRFYVFFGGSPAPNCIVIVHSMSLAEVGYSVMRLLYSCISELHWYGKSIGYHCLLGNVAYKYPRKETFADYYWLRWEQDLEGQIQS